MNPQEYLKEISSRLEELKTYCRNNPAEWRRMARELKELHAKFDDLRGKPEEQEEQLPALFLKFVRITAIPQWDDLLDSYMNRNLADPDQFENLQRYIEDKFGPIIQEGPETGEAEGSEPVQAAGLAGGGQGGFSVPTDGSGKALPDSGRTPRSAEAPAGAPRPGRWAALWEWLRRLLKGEKHAR
jgi:hypothetical protein